MADNTKVPLGIMMNQRTNCIYRKMREIVQSGEMGAIKRTNWIITDWYRGQQYYDSVDWRATWSGEGGGVLINQAPHQLDLMQWIFGLPKTVKAKCHLGKYHDIEVEDDVTLYYTYENGATALFHTSTGEQQGVNRLEIVGTKGRLVADGRQVTVYDQKTVVSQTTYEDRGGPARGDPERFRCRNPHRRSSAGGRGGRNPGDRDLQRRLSVRIDG